MSIFFISPAFAEPVDVEIDWTIEGQSKIVLNPALTEPSKENENMDKNIIDEQIKKESIKISNESEEFEDFITGSGYTIGTRLITIDSEEGQILNKIFRSLSHNVANIIKSPPPRSTANLTEVANC